MLHLNCFSGLENLQGRRHLSISYMKRSSYGVGHLSFFALLTLKAASSIVAPYTAAAVIKDNTAAPMSFNPRLRLQKLLSLLLGVRIITCSPLLLGTDLCKLEGRHHLSKW